MSEREEATITVNSKEKYNHSGFLFAKGETYEIRVPSGQTWKDKNQLYGSNGWTTSVAPLLYRPLIKLFEWSRRHPKANWFCLIGSIGESDDELFEIGDCGAMDYTAISDGEFCAFANDCSFVYGNNSGSIEVTMKKK